MQIFVPFVNTVDTAKILDQRVPNFIVNYGKSL